MSDTPPDPPPPPPPPGPPPASGTPAAPPPGPPIAPPPGPTSGPPSRPASTPPGPPTEGPARSPGDPSGPANPWSAAPSSPPSGDAGPLDPPADPGAGGGRRTAIAVLAVVAVVAMLGGLLVAFLADDGEGDDLADPAPDVTVSLPDPDEKVGDEDDVDDPDTTPPIDAPASTDPPQVDAQFEALIAELSDYVARARGLEFLRPVRVELAGDAAFEERLLATFDEEDREQFDDAEVFYRALGLLDSTEPLADTFLGLIANGVVGFYNTETDELVVRSDGGQPSAYVRQTIVHELVHALDDQHFELFRPEYDDATDEIGSGFTAVVEGNASRIENEWLADQPASVRAEARDEAASAVDAADYDQFPEILLFELTAPYQLGPVLVGEILRDGGERAVDAALLDPPTTSEQVLFPNLYAVREPAVPVPAPPVDGELVDEGVVGASFLFGLLTTGETTVNPSDAIRAIDGWGGDWAVTWRDDDADCVRIDVVGDTEQDTFELEQALTNWAEAGPVRVGPTDEGRVRLESCVISVGASPPQV